MKIIVIGAGVVGLSVAYELAHRGATVEVVDARGPGQGATRASAGILAPYIEGVSESLLALGLNSLSDYGRFVARVGEDAGQSIEYRCAGTLQVARDDAEAKRLADAATHLVAARIAHSLMDSREAGHFEPALRPVTSALYVPHHGYVGVSSLMGALESALSKRGVTISGSRVQSIQPRPGAVRVTASGGSIEADAAIVAAGSWSGELQIPGVPRIPVRPVRGQLLHLRLPSEGPTRVIWGESCYLVPWQDGSVLVGATVENVGFDETATAEGVRHLLESGVDLLPALEGAQFEEVRVGLRPATADGLPIVGPSSTIRGVFYATGHYRSGVLLAPFTADAVAALVLEGRVRPELALVRPDRFGL